MVADACAGGEEKRMISLDPRKIDLEKLKNDINTWAISETGKEAIQKAIQEVLDEAGKFREARFVDQKRLHEPVTV